MMKLLKNLINAESTPKKGELDAAKTIADFFKKTAIDVNIDSWDKNRANILAHIKSNSQKPAILFLCHLDVVEPGQTHWKSNPFQATEKNGRIYGRGAADMKAGTAAVAQAIVQIHKSNIPLKGDIFFLASAGEESDSCGIKRFLKNYKNIPNLTAVIVPEPTDFDVVTSHNGSFWLRIATTGKAAHGATPHLGINAISSAKILLDELENFKSQYLTKGCSLSVNTITGGNTINIVPDYCTIGIDIRTTIDQSHQEIIDKLHQLFEKIKKQNPDFNAEIQIIRDVNALQTDNESQAVKQFLSTVAADKPIAVSYCTDGSFLAPLNVPVIIFGPGNPQLCHKADEYVEIKDCEKAVEHYKNIIMKFLT